MSAFFVLEARGIRSQVAPQRCLLSSPIAKIRIIFEYSLFDYSDKLVFFSV